MELVLAMDLKEGLVVHGERGDRAHYRPLIWGASPVADPVGFVTHIRPASIYIADLDRISGVGSHDMVIRQCNSLVTHCYADRGCSGPRDYITMDHFENVIGTETCSTDLSGYPGGYLSLDMKAGKVIPSGRDPVEFLSSENLWNFEGCIVLDITAVGTAGGLPLQQLAPMRDAYPGRLLWGGGVASCDDLAVLDNAGFDGAIIATALHKGRIPIEMIRRGKFC
jgi:phosphoribosylformimino-5-aminoimidazole carboxamide ribotide isomerase